MVSLNGSGESHVQWCLPLVKVRVGHAKRIVLLSESVVSVATHWLGGSSLLCVGDGGECGGCSVSPVRTLGYTIVGVEENGCWVPSLLEASTGVFAAISALTPDTLSGSLYRVGRPHRQRALCLEYDGRVDLWPTGYGGEFRLLAAIAGLFRIPRPLREQTAQEYSDATLEARRLKLRMALERYQ